MTGIRGALVLLVVVAGTARAGGEGIRYVHQASTLTEPGNYRVTRDIAATTGNAISIQADGVNLDLGGFTVSVDDTLAAVVVIVGGVTDISISDGKLSGGSNGITYSSATERIRLRVERVEVTGPTDWCFFVFGAEYVEFVNNVATDCGQDGIYANGVSDAFGGRIAENTVHNAAGRGLSLLGLRGGQVRGNHILEQGGDGIHLAGDVNWSPGGNLVEHNLVDGGSLSADGIHVASNSAGNHLFRNVVTRNGDDGIHVTSDGNRILENSAADNIGSGLRIAGSKSVAARNQVAGNQPDGIAVSGTAHLIDANLIEGHPNVGINFISAGLHVYRDNVLRDNTMGAVGGAANVDGGGNVP